MFSVTIHSRSLSRVPTSYFTSHLRIPHVLPNILFCITYTPRQTHVGDRWRYLLLSPALQHLKLSLSSNRWFHFFLTWGWFGIPFGLLVGSLGNSVFKLRCEYLVSWLHTAKRSIGWFGILIGAISGFTIKLCFQTPLWILGFVASYR
jgi:hypothetical protein